MAALLLEMLYALLTLDLSWWFSLIMYNLGYVFLFVAFTFFFFDGKHMLRWLLVMIFYVFGSIGFWSSIGWAFITASFLMINYITRVAALTFAHDMPSFKDRLPFVMTLQFLVTLALYSFGLLG